MNTSTFAALERALAALPQDYPGPGGVAGVVKDGEVVMQRAWGYADLTARKPMTAATRMPICSITKQLTCAVLLDAVGEPAKLDHALDAYLPLLVGKRPTVAHLCHNQSGLRDYWALTVLQGAKHDGVFRREDARPLLSRARSTHFKPGTRYSYSNGNFRILADLIEEHTGRSMAELYQRTVFDPAGMQTAALTPDTSLPPDGIAGYEGNETSGYFEAVNRIYWAGDAGVSASLDDMLAWECFIDRTREDADGLYRRLSAPQTYADGRPAHYGFGLAHDVIGNAAITGHGGALRGFRSRRLYAPVERLSVVVMFNHEADAHAAATALMKVALGHSDADIKPGTWETRSFGSYLDSETGLALVASPLGSSRLALHFATSPETLAIGADGVARSPAATLARDGATLSMERTRENLAVSAERVSGAALPDIAGRYHQGELDAHLDIVSTDGVFYAGFDGSLGTGAMHAMRPLAEDLWLLRCKRSMDAPAPGDWTVRVRRDAEGKVAGLTIGCWLARLIDYAKIN
ncbi:MULTISPECIES: D-aminopeptidase [unclassified Ensifer]|uniref:D-aminopeptidase n=1 Tax=unclassified Ensifer TaxID=2633371 RepID=UPI0008132C37|nr:MULTISPECIES: D-aminopeptidase [unclassified Ensifer]OCP00483.1 aminopeptidase [Ensifer sp. LC14]OCP05853.1 aminopeptidase [Ensifer sp. LC11]OCP06602.1 aminopeptidase [Ensifer sp. LC13]OCP31158.1 aminopeptidase [Ensifer sp. LC499]